MTSDKIYLAIRVQDSKFKEIFELDAGVPNLYVASELLRSLAQTVGDHAEALEVKEGE